MTKKYLKVDVFSPLGSVFKGEADMVSLRGSAGEMVIVYGHTELLSTLPAGVVNVRKGQNTDVLYVSGG
ncbi:F0F1 ATP synthase subunit epsilon, partial [Francisella tularensis subsp. holarctica]|nr:F0F1 ATP synthase subunit epsilon [Francisella tularensis subsp. holarctica]